MNPVNAQESLVNSELDHSIRSFTWRTNAFYETELPMLVKRLLSDLRRELTASIPVMDGFNEPGRARGGGKVFALTDVRRIRLEESPLMLFNGVSEGAVRKMRQLSVEHWRHALPAFLDTINMHIKRTTANTVDDVFSSPQQLSVRMNVHRIVSYCLAPLLRAHERGALERLSIEHSMPFTMDLDQLAKLTTRKRKSLETARGRLFKQMQGSGVPQERPAATSPASLSTHFKAEVTIVTVS